MIQAINLTLIIYDCQNVADLETLKDLISRAINSRCDKILAIYTLRDARDNMRKKKQDFNEQENKIIALAV